MKSSIKFVGCEKCGKFQHPEVAWEATETGWKHLDCIEMLDYCKKCDGTSATGCTIICADKQIKETKMKPSIKTLTRMFTILSEDESNVDFSAVDYHAECIENIFEVTEIEAYELAHQLKENAKMNEFTMTGFYHVSKNGVMAFWKHLEQQGSLDLLYDMKPTTKVNELMLSEDFDLDAHIKTNYPREDYDTILIEINDEMIDAITALEFCFVTNQTHISFNGRSFENLDCIPSTDVWSPNYYLNCRSWNNIDDFGRYCMDTLCGPNDPGKVEITITLEGTDADTGAEELATQELNYTITGAADHNCLRNVIDIYKGWGYTNITFALM